MSDSIRPNEVPEVDVAVADEGPNGQGSLGRLVPWPDDETFANIDPEEALDLFLG